MSSAFDIFEHTVPGQQIRYYQDCVIDETRTIKLSVKQYRPKNNPKPQTGDVTFIVAGCNGYAKEVYEPFFEDLMTTLNANDSKLRVRNIWIADMLQMGTSALLNETNLGNEPSHYDHALDLLQFTNTFRHEMQQPIVGLGHSLGTTHLVFLSVMVPRLLCALVLIEPVMRNYDQARRDPSKRDPRFRALIKSSLAKRDVWTSMDMVEKSLASSTFYKSWDPRALQQHLITGYRATPTVLYPDPGHVTLVSTKYQETLMQARANLDSAEFRRALPSPKYLNRPSSQQPIHELPFQRVEGEDCFALLPRVQPPVLYINGSKSTITGMTPQTRRARLEATGRLHRTKRPSSSLQTQEKILEGGHFLPMECCMEVAECVAGYTTRAVKVWEMEAKERKQRSEGLSPSARQSVDDVWYDVLGLVKPKKPKVPTSHL